MTLQELYQAMGGDYNQALRILRVEKLIDKHIRKLPNNKIFPAFAEAGKSMDSVALFENAHAIKGVCSNLGLVQMAEIASDISEEFRPGNQRKMTDAEVQEKVTRINDMFENAVREIQNYE